MKAICEVSLAHIEQNLKTLHASVAPARLIPVVKANAYGHGAVAVVQHLRHYPAIVCFAVATLEEATELDDAFDDLPLLIFSRVFPDEIPRLPKHCAITLTSLEDARALAASATRPLAAHINVNTGMNRLGMSSAEALELIRNPMPNLEIEGIYTHFSSSDTRLEIAFEKQVEEIHHLRQKLQELGWQGMFHAANSAAALRGSELAFDAVRLGISLYGYDGAEEGLNRQRLIPAMRVRAPLVRVERISPGSSVSYGERWTATQPTNIGTLRIGYADGYNRLLTNRGFATDGTHTFPVVGTVTMDHIMVNLGDIKLDTGQYLTVIGSDCPETSVYRLAETLETISYEITCGISPRVHRVYLTS